MSRYYNATLTRAFHPPVNDLEATENTLAPLGSGLLVLGGVEFDVRGVIQLSGRKVEERVNGLVPRASRRIPVGLRCQRLHFLHATAWGDPEDTAVGAYRIHYRDGSQHEISLRYGVNILSWWLPRTTEPPELPQARRVWQGTNAWAALNNCYLVLYVTAWDNPLPEVQIEFLQFESKMADAGPFLVAVTAE